MSCAEKAPAALTLAEQCRMLRSPAGPGQSWWPGQCWSPGQCPGPAGDRSSRHCSARVGVAGAVSAQLTNELSLLRDQSWEWTHGRYWAQPRGPEQPGPAVATTILERERPRGRDSAAMAASAGLAMNLARLVLLVAMQRTEAHKRQQRLAFFFGVLREGKVQGRCRHPALLCAGPEGTA